MTTAVSVGALTLISCLLVQRLTKKVMTAGNPTITSTVDVRSLEEQVRLGLPRGTSLDDTQAYFEKLRIEHSFSEQSNTVYAVVRHLRGSSLFADQSLTFRLHFNDAHRLMSIETQVVYTGI